MAGAVHRAADALAIAGAADEQAVSCLTVPGEFVRKRFTGPPTVGLLCRDAGLAVCNHHGNGLPRRAATLSRCWPETI